LTAHDGKLDAQMDTAVQRKVRALPEVWLGMLLPVMLFGIFSLTVPNYLSVANLQQLATDFAEPALVALAMFLVVLNGGIDLSVGATFALANLAALLLFRVHGVPVSATVAIVVALGIAAGSLNGFVIAILGLGPFLSTLAMLLVFRGVYDLVSQASTLDLATSTHDGPVWAFMGGGSLFGLPFNFVVLAAIGASMHIFLTRVRAGIRVGAVGSDAEAARQAGIRVTQVRFWVYPAASAIVAVAGILYAARQDAASSNVGVGWESAALAAVVLGGVRLTGGGGSVLDALLGAGTMFLLTSGLLRMNAPGSAASAVVGGVLLCSVAAYAWARRHPRPTAMTTPVQPIPDMSSNDAVHSPSGGPFVRLVGASRTYGGIHAVRGADVDFFSGEIHALVGQNGAGKSTLARIVAGATPLSDGRLEVGGGTVRFRSPADGLKAGIAMVYQESSLVPGLSVARNLALGREPFLIDAAADLRDATAALAEWGCGVDPNAEAGQLSTAARQIVEIARAVRGRAQLLLFDEPTAALTPRERALFFETLSKLRSRGTAIVLVTHALEEALEHADRITVMRDGLVVQTCPAASLSRSDLVSMIVGSTMAVETVPATQRPALYPPAESNLSLRGVADDRMVRDMSFDVRSGEVVGMTGLVGSGRSEVARIAAGVGMASKGEVRLRGIRKVFRNPRAALYAGVVYVTEDRKAEGMFETLSAADNIVLGELASPMGRRILYPGRRARLRIALPHLKHLGVTAIDANAGLGSYSGGNQQKVVIARALAQRAEVVLFDEPTRGVDVGAIPQIHKAVRDCACEGRAVLAISSYLPEIRVLSDRILVAKDGRIIGDVAAGAGDNEILAVAMG
jgi:simple sugar transport system ATP-binding protein/ribose transport system ATP-binding protein